MKEWFIPGRPLSSGAFTKEPDKVAEAVKIATDLISQNNQYFVDRPLLDCTLKGYDKLRVQTIRKGQEDAVRQSTP